MNSSPHGWKTAVCGNTPSHGAQGSPHAFGHTDLLRHVGGGERLDNTGPQAVLPKLPPGVLTALVDPPTNDAVAEGYDRRAHKQLDPLKSLVLVGQQIDDGPLVQSSVILLTYL